MYLYPFPIACYESTCESAMRYDTFESYESVNVSLLSLPVAEDWNWMFSMSRWYLKLKGHKWIICVLGKFCTHLDHALYTHRYLWPETRERPVNTSWNLVSNRKKIESLFIFLIPCPQPQVKCQLLCWLLFHAGREMDIGLHRILIFIEYWFS